MANDASMRDYGLASPHGPNATGHHVATQDFNALPLDAMHPTEESAFRAALLPDDSYDADGVYWADMGLWKRWKFTSRVDRAEAKREVTEIGRMVKKDPLSPLGYYWRNMVIPGMGLLLEGYVLFSIGNIKPLFASVFPDCWADEITCNTTWLQSIEYLEVIGIIVGQILVGILGDWLGRRYGLIQDAVIMFVGLLMLTSAWGVTMNGWVICYVWSLFFYGIGVGGEYPMTATSGMENAVGSGKLSTRDDRLHRGRKVVSAFLMQGWGQFFNQILLILLLIIFHSGSGNPPYSKVSVQWTYRISFAIPAVGTLWLVYFRMYKMRSASKQLKDAKKKQHITGYDVQSLTLTLSHFGPRLLATAGTWFANDVFFYGNKLFQSEFITTINPDADSVMVSWLWNLVNVGVSLCGYYLASFLIDNKLYGRKWMMMVGFAADFICFIIPAFSFQYYANGPGIHSFQAMYYLSSFFNQFGPNCVTFLVAAEVFPTPIRASAHGFSAACGKLGALMAAVLYNYITIETRFRVVSWFGLAGALLTWLFLPDTTGLDLKEQERRWAFIREGRGDEYRGVAVHPKHLSVWERFRGVGKRYDAEEDFKMRVAEMRKGWEAAMVKRADDVEGEGTGAEDDAWSEEVSTFFERMRGADTAGLEKRGWNGGGAGGAGSDESDEEIKKEPAKAGKGGEVMGGIKEKGGS